jgi:glycosyltransferase involved in cell wall biosynthesis
MRLLWRDEKNETVLGLEKRAEYDGSIISELLTTGFTIIYRRFPKNDGRRPQIWDARRFRQETYDWSEVEAVFSSAEVDFKSLPREDHVVIETPLFTLHPRPSTKKASVKRWLQSKSPRLLETLIKAKQPLMMKSAGEKEGLPPHLLTHNFSHDITSHDTILIAMFWLQLGGAEKFAIETIEWLSRQGKNVIVVADQLSDHDWLQKIEPLTAAIYLISDLLPEELWPTFYSFLCKRHKISTIHIHHSISCYRSLPAIKGTFPKIKTVDTTHILELPKYQLSFPKFSVQYAQFIDLHHVISLQLKKYLIKNFVPESKIELCRLAPDPSLYTPKRIIQNKEDCITVGFLGRIAAQKRPLSFVRVAGRLKKFRIRFIMCGSGPLLEDCRKEARRLGIIDKIEFRSEVNDPRPFYQDIDILLIPSENEGIALVSYEAMLQNIPIVMPNVGAQSELLPDWLLVSPVPIGLESRITNRIKKLLEHKTELEDKSSQLRLRVEYLRNNNKIEKTWEKLYESLP